MLLGGSLSKIGSLLFVAMGESKPENAATGLTFPFLGQGSGACTEGKGRARRIAYPENQEYQIEEKDAATESAGNPTALKDVQ